jgi:hypothetical protein
MDYYNPGDRDRHAFAASSGVPGNYPLEIEHCNMTSGDKKLGKDFGLRWCVPDIEV